MKKPTIKEQLDALRELAFLYSQAAIFYKPRRFEHCHDENNDGGLGKLAREIALAYLTASEVIVAAKKRLLATGFNVPDSWLTVHAVGHVQTKCERVTPPTGKKRRAEPRLLTVVTDKGADTIALEKACDEMHAAILRLEVQSGAPVDTGQVAKELPALPMLPDEIRSDAMSLERLCRLFMNRKNVRADKIKPILEQYDLHRVHPKKNLWTIRLEGLDKATRERLAPKMN
jgi:hypothetical protein